MRVWSGWVAWRGWLQRYVSDVYPFLLLFSDVLAVFSPLPSVSNAY